MRRGLIRFEAWARDILRRAAAYDDDALEWCAFINLTAVSILVLVLVAVLLVWG